MLLELSITDFAIIEHLDIDFQAGMTVLTGETGAGNPLSSMLSDYLLAVGVRMI